MVAVWTVYCLPTNRRVIGQAQMRTDCGVTERAEDWNICGRSESRGHGFACCREDHVGLPTDPSDLLLCRRCTVCLSVLSQRSCWATHRSERSINQAQASCMTNSN